MRSLVAVAVLAAATSAWAKPSNPAFLGIGMQDQQNLQTQRGGLGVVGPCEVTNVTPGSGAKAAGLQSGDVLQTIDAIAVANCDAVLKAVQARNAGDTVTLVVRRYGQIVSLTATLVSRDEILRRRLVGQPIVATDLLGVDDMRSYDLSAQRGKTTIVGWFDANRCADCKTVFTKLADWTRKQTDKPGAQPMTLAVTWAADRDLDRKRLVSVNLDVPLAIAERSVYDEFTIPDTERIHFTIIDCRGVVQYVAPVAPNGEDTDAVLDELFAAAEQAARLALRR